MGCAQVLIMGCAQVLIMGCAQLLSRIALRATGGM
jgi:hypothetical protein